MTEKEKTHWLQNPNKNYLGHWDLPNGNPVILTIISAQWEEVKNPIINKSEAKRVIRFKESSKWVKPMICNQINAQMILKTTGEKYMEDCAEKRIKITVSQTKVQGEEVDCTGERNDGGRETGDDQTHPGKVRKRGQPLLQHGPALGRRDPRSLGNP